MLPNVAQNGQKRKVCFVGVLCLQAQKQTNQLTKFTTMDKTKTAVIIGILCLVGIGVVIYANRDKLTSKSETTQAESAE